MHTESTHRGRVYMPPCLLFFFFFSPPRQSEEEVVPEGRRGPQTSAVGTAAHEDVPRPASSAASESPMISQAEEELLMWLGLRPLPLPDQVRKPKLRRQGGKGRTRGQAGNQGLRLNIARDCQTGLWESSGVGGELHILISKALNSDMLSL